MAVGYWWLVVVGTLSIVDEVLCIGSKQIDQTLRICSEFCDRVITTYHGLRTSYTVSGRCTTHPFSRERPLGGVNISSK